MSSIPLLPSADLGRFSAVTRADERAEELRARAGQLRHLERFGKKRSGDEDPLREVAAEFAGLFLGEMFKTMNQHKPMSEFGTGGREEQIFREMAFEEYGRSSARQAGNPLTELVYRSLQRRPAVVAV